MTLRITHVRKRNRPSPWERITAVDCTDGNRSYRLSQERVVDYINSREHEFVVVRDGRPVSVVVATSQFGNSYIKTEADGEQPNNLLSLPECP